jgi:hypothetical protein
MRPASRLDGRPARIHCGDRGVRVPGRYADAHGLAHEPGRAQVIIPDGAASPRPSSATWTNADAGDQPRSWECENLGARGDQHGGRADNLRTFTETGLPIERVKG